VDWTYTLYHKARIGPVAQTPVHQKQPLSGRVAQMAHHGRAGTPCALRPVQSVRILIALTTFSGASRLVGTRPTFTPESNLGNTPVSWFSKNKS
jgi:hypothetical protein